MAAKDLADSLGKNKPLSDLGLDRDRLGQKTLEPPKGKARGYSKYTTSGTLTNPKVASLEDAPNYGTATSKATSCHNCKAFQRTDSLMGSCEKYGFYARNDYTCDGWKKKN